MSTATALNATLKVTYEACVWKPCTDGYHGYQVVYPSGFTHTVSAQEGITDLLDESDSLDRICKPSDLNWARDKASSSLVWKVGAVLWRNRK